jgi:hypothetical protein
MYRALLIYCVLPFALSMGGLGYAMTGGGTIADVHKAKACKGFVVFNGERIPKCEDLPTIGVRG